MKKHCIVLCTTNSRKKAESLAKHIINARLAACVNIIPEITSIYHWDNKVCVDSEMLLIIKTMKNLFKKLKSLIEINHTYEVPEIICIDISIGNKSYLNWMRRNCLKS